MKGTKTGKNRLRGELPEEANVAHKLDGWETASVNHIEIIFITNGKHFIISVFITESKEDIETNEKIISDISKVTWDYFMAVNR